MELLEALTQISEIRQQMTRSEVYRGYRSLTTSVSSMLAILGAVTQPLFVASPDTELGRYLIFWIGIAAVSAIVVGSEVWWRARRTDSEVLQQMTRLAVEQLSPSLVVGALLTLCIFQTAPQVSWMLPGLWALIFSLGIFASHRLLPPQSLWVALYYASCGLGCLYWGQGANALSPWQMGICFGGGQLMSAAILFWTLERTQSRCALTEVP